MLKITWPRIQEELARQREKGYNSVYDQRHERSELIDAATAYLLQDAEMWPWRDTTPTFDNRSYIKAAALLRAEVNRRRLARVRSRHG